MEWKRGEKTKVKRFLDFAGKSCGISEEIIFNRRQKKFSINDTLWSLCIEYILKNRIDENFQNVQWLYYAMERILEEEGKNSNYVTKRRFYFNYLQYKKSGCSFVIPVCTDEACDACKKIDGMEILIDDAIKNQPLPPKDCTCKRCTCVI
ncbi:MAG: hypothetical protein WCX46_01510 [Candidatus Paceibacterota bacterium]